MKRNKALLLSAIVFLLIVVISVFAKKNKVDDSEFVSNIVDTRKQEIKLYWKDQKQDNFSSIKHLKTWLDKKHQLLLFAMNGGMYKQDGSPQGLYIENQITLSHIDTTSGNGNFYLKPNGIFYITTDNIPVVCNSTNFNKDGKIKYATQPGPMLLMNGKIHPAFKEGSANKNIRNGVGILPDNKVIFAMSKKEISFYDFANYFKSLGCKNALYLDELVSRMYLPEKNWMQTDGNFGVIIGMSERIK